SLNAPPPPHIYTLSLHDALPISPRSCSHGHPAEGTAARPPRHRRRPPSRSPSRQRRRRAHIERSAQRPASCSAPRAETVGYSSEDRKSTRLNSSHVAISYAVFCL